MICIDCGNNKERNELVWIGNPWGEEIHHEQGLEKLVW